MPGTGQRSLTVDSRESNLLSTLRAEHDSTQRSGFWFQLDRRERQRIKTPWGPGIPQPLNRCAYAPNNPIRYTDRRGHGPGDGQEPSTHEGLEGILRTAANVLSPERLPAHIQRLLEAATPYSLNRCLNDEDRRGALNGLVDDLAKHPERYPYPSDFGAMAAPVVRTRLAPALGRGRRSRSDGERGGPMEATNHRRFRLVRAAQRGVTEQGVLDGLRYGCERSGNSRFSSVGTVDVEVILDNNDVPQTVLVGGDDD